MNIWTFLTLIVFSFFAFSIYLSYKLEDRIPQKEKRVFKWHKAYRLIGGSLTIIASIPSIIVSGSIIFFSHIPGCIFTQAIYVLMFIVPIFGMVGGFLSILRRHYRFAVIGALCGVLGSLLTVYFILGFGVMAALIGLFLIAFSKRQFVN
jgi:hypothetical protein